MASSNSEILGWAERMAAHFQSKNISSAELEKQNMAARMLGEQPIVVSEQIIDFLKQYEKQKIKDQHMAEIKTAGNNYDL